MNRFDFEGILKLEIAATLLNLRGLTKVSSPQSASGVLAIVKRVPSTEVGDTFY